MSPKLLSGLAACAVSLLVALSPASAETVTVIDTMGRQVNVPTDAKRVLLGFYFEDFYAIGGKDAYDRVVAISRPTWKGWRGSQWKAYVAVNPKIAKLVDVGEVESGTFSIETAISVKPDVVILAAWQFRALGETVSKLEAAGIPVAVADYNAQTVEKHVASTLMIGKILGQNDRAKKLADQYSKAVADVLARVKKAGGKPKNVYVELGNKGAGEYGNSYGKGMWGGVIDFAGGNNIALGKIENWGPLNPEYVIASNPQAVFIAGSYWAKKKKSVIMGFGVTPEQTRARLAPYVGRPGWSGLDAVKSGNVHALYHGGARTLYDYTFLQYIAKALHPEAFADVDPVANHRRFYEAWLPVKADGTFAVSFTD
jgi:ABC-type Fe3+-hydroxamate transport system substrate-binding protein